MPRALRLGTRRWAPTAAPLAPPSRPHPGTQGGVDLDAQSLQEISASQRTAISNSAEKDPRENEIATGPGGQGAASVRRGEGAGEKAQGRPEGGGGESSGRKAQ